jgi:hypothetical protein
VLRPAYAHIITSHHIEAELTSPQYYPSHHHLQQQVSYSHLLPSHQNITNTPSSKINNMFALFAISSVERHQLRRIKAAGTTMPPKSGESKSPPLQQ